jgi:hypothetical protein
VGLRRRTFARAAWLVASVVAGASPAMAGVPALPALPTPTDPPPAPQAPRVQHVVRQRVKAHESAPAANAILHVTPGALGTPWTFEVTNQDNTPLRIVTDGRLLSLDIMPGDDDDGDDAHPKKHAAAIHCALPVELRPTNDADRVRILPPDVTYVEEFDPRMYCFSGSEARALSPDSKLVARLGWTPSRSGADSPPFVADQTLAGRERTGMKELVSGAVTVPDTISSDPEPMHRHPIVAHAAERIDAESGKDLVFEVSAENTTTRPIHLMLRPETLAFEVSSTKGVTYCSGKTHPASPIAEVFTEIPPHGRASTSVLLASICPDTTFRSAGLYTVEPRIDTRHASGKAIGLDTFDGVVRTSEPTLVRIRRDRARRP